MSQEILDFLRMIGVNNQFISIYNEVIYINNLKFSRFSRKKEELFIARYPEWKVVRSKLFQKMCVRASRVLSKSLHPKEHIFLEKSCNCEDIALYIILEPYTRKYGVQIIFNDDLDNVLPGDLVKVASTLTLDGEVENIISQMLQGKKIEPTTSDSESWVKMIYPLINIPSTWIETWMDENDFPCEIPHNDMVSHDLIEFLAEYIPDVRENILKSTQFVYDKKQ